MHIVFAFNRHDNEIKTTILIEGGPSALYHILVADRIIDTVKKVVDEQLSDHITLKKISSMLYLNCAYLGQKFKQHENMSFNEYLLQMRMERAKQLLENTDMRIYEVASEVGYSELDWFYKKFKAYTGLSASEYRRIASQIA